MNTAAHANRHASSKTINTIAGLDLSSWVSWACYGLGLGLAVHMAPDMASDLMGGGAGLAVLAGAIAAFFALVLILQNQMSGSPGSNGQATRLLTEGAFALSRNPMYVAFLVPISSIALYSPLSAAAAAALYVLAMNTLIISVEEDTLSANFGNRYRNYCKDTPRWLVW